MTLKNNQLYQLTLTQFLETIREPSVLFWGIVFPILISIGLGLAFTQAAEYKYNIAIVESQSTNLDSLLTIYAKKQVLKDKIIYSWSISDEKLGNTEIKFSYMDWDRAIVALKRNEADMMVSYTEEKIAYHFDPHNTQSQLAYIRLSELLENPTITAKNQDQIQPLTLKGVRYIDFLIPGLIALGILNGLCWGISYGIVERRSQKLLRRMVATPMRKSNFLVAMILVRIAMNFLEAGLLFFFAWLCFGTIIQGNIGALLALFLAGNIAFAGIAVLIASHTAKTEVGNGLINAITMPMMVLSGIFFSYHNFPQWSIGFIKLLPLTAFTDGLRSIFNEGAGWVEIASPSLMLSALGVLCFLVGIRVFRWF